MPDWDFDRVREGTREQWNRELSHLQIESSTEEKETFYTSLYHCCLAPGLYEDVNGEYRGLDSNIHRARAFTNYTVFSLQDTIAPPILFRLSSRPRAMAT